MADSKQRENEAGEPHAQRHADSGTGGAAGGSPAERADTRVEHHPGATLGAAGAGAMQSVGEVGGSAVSASRNVLRGAIGATEEVGTGLVGGVAHIATDVVHGVTDLGYEVRNGATGLIGAVGDIGTVAVNTVAHLLVDVVGGVRQVVAAAVGNHAAPDVRAGDALREHPEYAAPGRQQAGRTGEQPRA